MSEQDIQTLINDYLEAVENSLKLFELKIGSRELLKLWRDKKIPQRGKLTEEISYQLHGNGCMLEYPNTCIDFDFSPDGRTDGFDAWRLYNFACEKGETYKKFKNLEIIREEIKRKTEQGLIRKSQNPYSNLYFIK